MFAERMGRVEGSPTVALGNLAAELRAKGKSIISLSVGQPDFPTPKHIVEAAKQALDDGLTRYTPSRGIPELREAIVEKSRRENGIACEDENVLVTPTKHAIFETFMALVGPGDEVLIPDPAWVSYVPAVQLVGGTPVLVPTSPADDYIPSAEAIRAAATPRTKMLVLNTPSNPAGSVISRETLEEMAALAEELDFWILSDEIYEKILFDGEHVSVASLDGMFERTVTVNGFSKGYSMTGWRLGWLVAPGNVVREVVKVQEHTVTCATAFAQAGGVAALTGPQGPVEAMVAAFRRRRDLVVERLKAMDGFRLSVPRGAFYVFPQFLGAMDGDALARHLLEEAGVAVVPGSAFGSVGRSCIRISFAASEETLRSGLDSMEDSLSQPRRG
jgi:aspartate aminotransferase